MEIFYNVKFFIFIFNFLLGFKKESYLLLISIAYGTYAIPCHDLGIFSCLSILAGSQQYGLPMRCKIRSYSLLLVF